MAGRSGRPVVEVCCLAANSATWIGVGLLDWYKAWRTAAQAEAFSISLNLPKQADARAILMGAG